MKALLLILVLFAIPVFGQTVKESAKPVNPKYDAELAKKVGANEYGMRRYVVAILKTGPNDGKFVGEERSKLMKGHLDNIKRLAAEGKMAMAGPFGKNEVAFRGLFILAVPTIEEAKALAETDPTVKAGIFVVEYVPWNGAAALMMVNELWEKTAKESF